MVMLWCSIEHITCVVGHLHHAVVVFRREVEEIEISRINRTTFVMHLIVKVRTGGFAGTTHHWDYVATLNLLSLTYERF